MSDMGNTDLGSGKMGNRGVSAMKGYRVPQSGYQMPTQKLGVNPAQPVEKYDPHNTTQRWSTPAYTSFVRKNLKRPGFVPEVEDF